MEVNVMGKNGCNGAASDTITDIDGNIYRCVKIGDQWWMAENLRVTHYRNKDPIDHITESSEWAVHTEGAYCNFDNNEDEDRVSTYGRLYNAYVIEDTRGVCPEGWHVPSDEEWIQLESFLGMSEADANEMTAWRGTDEGAKLKSNTYGGSDEVGFTADATGYRTPEGEFRGVDSDNNYWTSTTYDNDGTEESLLHGFAPTRSDICRNYHVKSYAFCLRCIKSG